jgi:hypothetical protein
MRNLWPSAMIVVVLALGCASAAPPQVAQVPAAPRTVQLGMSAAQVEQLLGKPAAKQGAEADPQLQVWVYDVGRVVLNNGKVVLTDPAPLPIH